MPDPIPAILSLLIGTVAGFISFLGLWGVVYLFTSKSEPETQRKVPASVLITSLILKLPALGIGFIGAKALSASGPAWFGLGIVLVYSGAVTKLVLNQSKQ